MDVDYSATISDDKVVVDRAADVVTLAASAVTGTGHGRRVQVNPPPPPSTTLAPPASHVMVV